ncbi:MAG: DUF2066 domain-containing protein [Coxiellaceae bacterium]|jgi:hypothetical protein|nr:DUF2066 domain-containing protein [Coxiellaceae bacterium]
MNFLLILILSILTPVAFAEKAGGSQENTSPYVVEMPVSDDSNVQRKKVFTQALSLVLVRVSNNSKIDILSGIKQALDKPDLYVQQFKYINKGLSLQIIFDPNSIAQLLQRSLKRVQKQSTVLAWSAKESRFNKFSMEEGDRGELTSLIKKQSQAIGISITLPMWDLQDIENIQTYDICHFNESAIKIASSRYKATSIIVGCVKPAVLGNGIWVSTWLLLQADKSQRFSFVGPIENIVTEALQNIANNITTTNAPVQQSARLVLRVVDVNGLDQYNEIIQYLYSLSKAITQIDLVNINATYVELAINVLGGQEALLNILKMQDRLVPNPDVVESPQGIDLNYKWVTLDNEKSQAIST